MPATFPSHQGVVLPLKLWRPGWFDGVALAAGAASPDVAYLLDGSGLPVWPFSHQIPGLVGWCLPVSLVVAWLLRRAAPVVAAHLPSGGGLALPSYGALRHNPHRWYVTGSSVLVGAGSHLAIDALEASMPNTEPALHLIGGVAALLVLRRVGRRGLIRQWHGDPPPVPRRPRLFWGIAVPLAVAGAAATPLLPAAELSHTTGVRLLATVVGALMVAAACHRLPRPAAWRGRSIRR